MMLRATPLTAALAGMFSAIVWPLLWPMFQDDSSSSIGLVLSTLLVIALPAHACVVGFHRSQEERGGRTLDTALLKRIGAWLLAAAVTAALSTLYQTPSAA